MIARVSSVQTTTVAPRAAEARRSNTVVRANAKEQACAAVLAMTIAATPMANAAVEVTQVAGNSKDLAGDLFAAQQAKLNTKPAKPAKSFAAPSASAPSLPSFSAPSLPSFSVPSFGSKKDAAPKAEAPKKEAAAKSSSGSSEGLNLGLVMAVLFSPLLVVQAVTFGTFARLAGGKK